MKWETVPNTVGWGVVLALGLPLGLALQGCATSGDGVRQETSTPTSIRIQWQGGGEDVHLTSELSKGTFHLEGSLEDVWSMAPGLFEELGVEINYQNPAGRAIGNNNFRLRRLGGVRNSRYLDCGFGSTAVPHADGYEVTASLVISFRPGEGGTTIMETLFAASARARDVSGGNVACTSKGTLESTMAEILAGMLAESAGEI